MGIPCPGYRGRGRPVRSIRLSARPDAQRGHGRSASAATFRGRSRRRRAEDELARRRANEEAKRSADLDAEKRRKDAEDVAKREAEKSKAREEAAREVERRRKADEDERAGRKRADDDARIRHNEALARVERGKSLCRQGRPSGRDRRLRRGDPADPKLAAAYLQRGISLANTGDHTRAIVDYTEALALEPQSPVAYYAARLLARREG